MDGVFFFDVASGTSPTMIQNLVSQTMTDAQRDAILADLDAALTKYHAYEHPLTPDDRKSLARVRGTNIGLLELALTFAQQNPAAIPAGLNVAELAKDIALAKQLAALLAKAEMVRESVDDTYLAVLSDGYVCALDIYRVAKALGGGAQFDAFIDAFGQRFARRSTPAPAPTP